MNHICVFMCALFLVVVVDADFYSSKYDEFDVKPLLENNRILLNYTKCFLDQGPCTAEAKDFKSVLPETLSTACAFCTPKQKTLVRKLLLGIRAKSEPRFHELLDKYDPDIDHRAPLYAFLLTGNN